MNTDTMLAPDAADSIALTAPVPSADRVSPKRGSGSKLLDRLGISASMICAVHCALLPFALSVLPLLGLGFLTHGSFELAMIVCSALIGTASLGSSYRIHGKLNPLLMMASGAIILTFNFLGHHSHSPLVETLHPFIAGFGGVMIASAHRVNMRLCATCDRCAHEHEHSSDTDVFRDPL